MGRDLPVLATDSTRWPFASCLSSEELTVSVGERPELPDNEKASAAGRGNGRTNGSARGKRGRPRRAAAVAVSEFEDSPLGDDGGGVTTAGNGGDGGGGGGSRERALRRLLVGLRAIDAGDF
ncbi:MAG TPA: hypothetical protein VM029_20120, partial [Opitutaceae bacterium]|nr:hypothetical protein [Opitutaceae bacterium]